MQAHFQIYQTRPSAPSHLHLHVGLDKLKVQIFKCEHFIKLNEDAKTSDYWLYALISSEETRWCTVSFNFWINFYIDFRVICMVAFCHKFFSFLSIYYRRAEDDDTTLAQQSGRRDDQINSLRPPPIQESHSDMKPQHWAGPAKILEEIQPPKTCLSIPSNVGLICTIYFFWSL